MSQALTSARRLAHLLVKLMPVAGAMISPVLATPLNDSGLSACYDASGSLACNGIAGDADSYPRQDGRYGRDAAQGASVLVKEGNGGSGFDFSKIANDGSGVAPSTPLGTGATDWACTRDNITGLTWEVKTLNPGPRLNTEAVVWYSTQSTTNGGYAGTSVGGGCSHVTNCNSEQYVSQVNTAGLCGHNDWRLPTPAELRGIANMSQSGSGVSDSVYFPNMQSSFYLTATTSAVSNTNAVIVNFGTGSISSQTKSSTGYVILVR
ncbi:Lcl C-terminal domain-containing protein [Parachitinimonas caeni]|uniref:DUF1566 domain-containing protein n=1 Tax=Parachitinimonas caeni TaxID=3031301 RepID=A0ABT7DW56_9NEIS|nr:DUF1566 domain-containing protein [Parachitinimonas caeni]MDK2124282.1 DUF1566 domain-containing protein [Parachitinimonas caeni]